VSVFAGRIQHTIPCVGYVFKEADKKGHIMDGLKSIIRPGPIYKDIKSGLVTTVKLQDGTEVDVSKYVSPQVPGRKVGKC
jgi:hypothetical protein